MRRLAVSLVLLLACGAASAADFKVCTLPLGDYDKKLLDVAEKGIVYLYGFEVERLKRRKLPQAAWYPARKRWRAEKILDWIDSEVLPEASQCNAIIGFTKADVSTTKDEYPDWGVLGLGNLGGTSAVVSSFRMKAAKRRTVKRRAVSTVNHELGHVLGADHDDVEGCIMNDAKGTVKSIDKENGLLCAESRKTILEARGIELPDRATFDWDAVIGK